MDWQAQVNSGQQEVEEEYLPSIHPSCQSQTSVISFSDISIAADLTQHLVIQFGKEMFYCYPSAILESYGDILA
ncbi:hypothetical protein ACTXT7_014903 [Hymenolepis weldensis]